MVEQAQVMEQTVETSGGRAGKYLTFTLAKEDYGIEILKVKEIIGMIRITPIPRTPDYVKGVINLRGRIIPVLDLRTRFGMDQADYTERTCIIVVELRVEKGQVVLGVVVDSVSEVLNVKPEEIEGNLEFGAEVDTDYILGLAKMSGGVKILLDIDRALSAEEISLVEKTA